MILIYEKIFKVQNKHLFYIYFIWISESQSLRRVAIWSICLELGLLFYPAKPIPGRGIKHIPIDKKCLKKFCNEYAIKTKSVHTAPTKILLVASFLNRSNNLKLWQLLSNSAKVKY